MFSEQNWNGNRGNGGRSGGIGKAEQERVEFGLGLELIDLEDEFLEFELSYLGEGGESRTDRSRIGGSTTCNGFRVPPGFCK